MGGSDGAIDGLELAELRALVVRLLAEQDRLREENEAFREAHCDLERENAALRDEVARLKGLKGRPDVKPSGMEKKTEPRAKARAKKRRRGPKLSKLTIDEEKVVEARNVPAGSRFKGYQDYVVQDLLIRPWTTKYRCARWRTPSGETIVAPLPGGIHGHFGARLKCFVLMQYHKCRVTVGRLLELLHDIGVAISRRQLVRFLNEGQGAFLDETRDILRSGLESASWITVDDTGARHRGRNGVCTHIGNDQFAWFATTFSKSRLNFLQLLAAGDDRHLINEAATAYMRARNLPETVIGRLWDHERTCFAGAATWTAHLRELGLTDLEISPDPVRIATEGALWGNITAQGLLDGTVIVSDGAGQFKVGAHALCWVHAERLIHKLNTFCEPKRQAKERLRSRIWWFYADLKAYCRDPTAPRKTALKQRFDRIFTTETGFVTLDRLLRRLHAQKHDLLAVLERPDIPLHTNGSENDIRCQVIRRKISGGTRSDPGRDCRDAYLSLMKTCAKQSVSFWDYLGNRLTVPGAPHVPQLPDLIRQSKTA
jgi:hypothetical protein